jgi:hypothetical protein
MPHPVERYLRSMGEIRRTGAAVPETSYYGALETLLNEVGSDLSPRVRAVLTLRDEGAGLPDGGFFTADQLASDVQDPLARVLPARGVVEVKSPDESVREIAEGGQVRRYAERYGQVLVTNYREFLLVARDPGGIRHLEYFELAADPSAFWTATGRPRAGRDGLHKELVDFLKRVMLWPAAIREPSDLAWILASYAREGLRRVEGSHLGTLMQVREGLENALGVEFRGERGDHFFQSTLIQTLFYGIFSAWVLWHRDNPARVDRFDWRLAEWSLRVPMIRALFEHVATASRVEALGLTDILGWASAALARVDRPAFFDRFQEEHAVQYFYEPFLEAFDPQLRKELGVWYTPPEVVEYMVERVDRVLREELAIADGLADDRVVVLDPCCGTGAYLVEVLERIGRTLRDRGESALVGAALRRAASERVFGFEILPAPFVVAHLQLGLLLHDQDGGREPRRLGVYLTNALTGWRVGEDDEPIPLPMPEMEAERDAAEDIKREQRVLVVLGNPPYNGFAGMGMAEEQDLVEPYRQTDEAPLPRGQGLNDLYVRFYRMAERRITEMTGRGVVCFISNYSWLDGLSFTGMRERFINAFDRVWIDSLNGDKYRTGKLTLEGDPDPSVFSTERNREGIQVGTAIGILVRRDPHESARTVLFRNFWGQSKRQDLLASIGTGDPGYEMLEPAAGLGFPFRPTATGADYLSWPKLPELMPLSFPGVKTSRDEFLVDIDRTALELRVRAYFDPAVSDADMERLSPRVMQSTRRFDALATRRVLQARGYRPEGIVPYLYRPFDVRWLYWEGQTKLLDEKRSEYVPHVRPGVSWIEARQKYTQDHFDRGYVTSYLADNFGNGLSHFFPLHLNTTVEQRGMFDERSDRAHARPNISPVVHAHLKRLGADPHHLFHHILATLHSPEYAAENAGALRQDWPRVPLHDHGETLLAGAELGQELARLLDPEQISPGVSSGDIREELRVLGVVQRTGGGELGEADLALTVGWGHVGARGAIMPGRGRVVEREYTADERASIAAGSLELGLGEGQALALLGETTMDVYLNDVAYWGNVPVRVWEYTLGGYPVVKKWLSYREQDVLGRALKLNEVRYVTSMVRRIAAILLLGPALDAHYAAAKERVVEP